MDDPHAAARRDRRGGQDHHVVQVGRRCGEAGDNLFEIETDKVTMEVPATEAGILSEIRVPEGEVAPVGAIVGVIGDGSGAFASVPVNSTPAAATAKAPATVEVPQASASVPKSPQQPIKLDPFLEVRRKPPCERDGKPVFKLSLNDFIIRALALALQRVPAANAAWAGDRILRFKHSDVGVAVALDGGLIVPIIRQAETKTLSAISAEMKDLAARAREKKLKPAEYQGGSSAISNLGMYGVREFSAIINPPQATILAVGAARRQAIEKPDGGVAFRQHAHRDAVLRSPCRRRCARGRASGRHQGADRNAASRP